MFVRKKRNKIGSVSIQVIDKSSGYRVVETIGSAREPDEIERLVDPGQAFIERQSRQYSLFPKEQTRNATILDFARGLKNSQIRTIGPELVFGLLFDRLGFGAIPDRLFRDIVIARLAYPTSKLKTVDYLYRYQGKRISVDRVYRFLDQLADKYKEQVERIAYDYSRSVLKTISVIFYDMTTLYFETEDEDDLRKIGFSKDGKFEHPLIVSYTEKRAVKDVRNREKGLRKLRSKIGSGRLTKQHVNQRGYNKFLRLVGEVMIEVDETKVEQAARWDGLKGYLTNTDHSASTVIENYRQLWRVEKAFRISKTDLRIRPIHHYKARRIKAHVCVAFVAYTLYKELERILEATKSTTTVQRAVELTHTMYQLIVDLPDDPKPEHVLLRMDSEQQELYDMLY